MNLGNLIPGVGGGFWASMAKFGQVKDWIELVPHPDENACGVNIKWGNLTDGVGRHGVEWLATAIRKFGPNDALTCEALSRVAADGPKLFKLTEEQCESLEHVDIRLTVGEYSQPYPAMLVQFPPAWVARTRAQYPQFVCPDFEAVRWWPEHKFAYILGIHKSAPPAGGDNCMVLVHNETRTIEQALARAIDMPTEEAQVMARYHRIALNAMLLLMQHGSTTTASNPEFLERSRAFYRKRRLETTDLEIRTHVYNVALQQQIVVRGATVPRDPGDGTHASPHPHWRRGHWARQRHGTGRTLVKLVFRAPVFVMGDQFVGDRAQSSVTYTLKP